MTDDGTVPLRSEAFLLRVLRLLVLSGPDAGKRFESESDVLTIGSAESNDLVLRDPTVSRFHLELRRAEDRIVVVDQGSTNGTLIGPVLVDGGAVSALPGALLKLGNSSFRVDDGRLVSVEPGSDSVGELRGRSTVMRRLMASIERVARTDVPVSIVGESGTGKELVARAIHDLGPRKAEPFVTVDCAAIAPTLFASELFGHERGAFTGADRQHIGAFERAGGGTLFLDEIGELTPQLQSALLGVLERRRFQRVGGHQEIEVDVRVVSATHRDLRSAVNAGSFRLDLYYRLAAVLLKTPPLRERPEDIPLLLEQFLRDAGYTGPVSAVFPETSLSELAQHAWPGNVRELKNVVLGTLALGTVQTIEPPEADLQSASGAGPFERLLGLSYRDARRALLDEFELRYVESLLARSKGNIRQAARLGRMDRSYLMELIRRHRLRAGGD